MTHMPMKLVVLDRDGTINEDRDDYVKSPEEWVPLDGSLEAIISCFVYLLLVQCRLPPVLAQQFASKQDGIRLDFSVGDCRIINDSFDSIRKFGQRNSRRNTQDKPSP